MNLKQFLSVLTVNVVFSIAPASLANQTEEYREIYQYILNTYPQDLEQARQLGDPQSQLGVLIKGASAHQYFAEFEKAIALYKQALVFARQIQDEDIEGSILWSLATVYSKLGDAYGIEFLESELDKTTRLSSRKVLLNYLSLAYTQAVDYEKVIVLRQEHLQIVREIGTTKEEAEALNNLGLIYYSIRQYNQAIQLQEEALSVVKTIDEPILQGGILVHLGISYSHGGQQAKALEQFQALLQLGKEQGNRFQVEQALEVIAEYYTIQEDYQRAIALQEERLASTRENSDFTTEAFTLQDLSKVYYWSGDLDRAIALQTQALDILNQGFVQQQAQTPVAAESLEYSRIATQSLGQEQLGFLHLQRQDYAAAKSSFRKALNSYDLQREQTLTSSNFSNLSEDQIKVFTYDQSTDIYRLLQKIAIQENQLLKALELSEAGRARALVDLLVGKLATAPDEIATTNPPNISQIQQIAQQENSTLVTYTVQYEYGRFYQNGPGEWLKGDPPDKIATDLYIWVIQPDGEITFRSIALNFDLNDRVRTARNFITFQGRSRRRLPPGEPLKELHTYLIEPIADLLPSDPQQRVTFIPQDSLLLVPFPALQDANGTYLIDKHTILTSPSIQVLDLTRQNRERNQQQSNPTQALVVGNPTMPEIELEGGQVSIQLDNLPGAEEEAEAIATLLNTQPLIGDAATKPATIARMESAPIIHLATHGLLDDNGGFLSSLALAPTDDDRGFLTAKEIAELSLQAELAVLSACDTGRGAINGDGVIGLSRAFVSAGAEGVLVSLWAIPDQPTVTVMKAFYQQIQNGKDKASALREAMAIARQQFPEPQNWAAFTFIGVPE